jgi:hypothetical protein
MMSKDRAAAFIASMTTSTPDEEPAEVSRAETQVEAAPAPAVIHELPRSHRRRSSPKATKPVSRTDLKHFGGYLDDETLEKIAVLRIRLKMDNSALIKHAIEELHRKHNAKRAFGDA